jgi:hypothetical protein
MRYSLDNADNGNNMMMMEGPASPLRSPPAPQTSMIRPRPPTSAGSYMTPDAKRNKIDRVSTSTSSSSSVLLHPERVPVPSKRTISTVYRAALSEEGDQAYLKPAGLLSLEQVLLPAMGLEEEKVLKQMQSKIQRDAPDYKPLVEQNRRLVRKAILRAMEAVRQSREERCRHQQDLRQARAEQRKLEREARARALEEERAREAEERRRQREVERQERKRVLQKQLPGNQELWKEVIFLTSSITQLEREERMWIQAEQQLIQHHPLTPGKTSDNDDSTTKDQAENEKEVVIAPKHSLQEEAERTLQDVALASTRIQTGLGVVLEIMQEAEHVRKEMYQKYKDDHQFEGYQQVHNPKNMIRFLSQDEN